MRKSLWAAVVIVVVIVAAIIIYAVVRKPAKTTTTSSATTSQTTPQNSSSSNAAVVQAKTNSSVGQYLADSQGNALYTYGADTSGVSNCEGSCLSSWPIYSASNPPTSLPANVTIITRSDGSKQYAYKGLPLYTFTSDTNGSVTGDGLSNFHIAKP